MTTFTDDLENDLEVLAEHHDVTQVQVAKSAFALLPSHVQDALIRSLWTANLKPWSELASPPPEPVQEHTGLPQTLRGAVHALTRNYPANLVVDAVMLEMPEKQRQDVARAFLPREEPQLVKSSVRSELVERSTGKVLHQEHGEHFGPAILRLVHEDGSYSIYRADRLHILGSVETELRPDGSKVMRTYYVEDAEQ